MNNEPVAWMYNYENFPDSFVVCRARKSDQDIPLYTHPVKENWKCSGPPCKCNSNNYKVCGYSNYTHPVKELTDKITEQEKFIKAILKKGGCDGNICQKYNANPVKELTDEEIKELIPTTDCYDYDFSQQDLIDFARAILRKAQEK